MYEGLKSIRRERAIMEKNRVLISSMMEDSKINSGFESLRSDFFEGVSNDEIEELISRLPESDDEDNQVDRILSADGNLNVDQILGIDSDDLDEIIEED